MLKTSLSCDAHLTVAHEKAGAEPEELVENNAVIVVLWVVAVACMLLEMQ